MLADIVRFAMLGNLTPVIAMVIANVAVFLISIVTFFRSAALESVNVVFAEIDLY
ncbi:hypothetical protein D3C72_2367970 [compost metagenome]